MSVPLGAQPEFAGRAPIAFALLGEISSGRSRFRPVRATCLPAARYLQEFYGGIGL